MAEVQLLMHGHAHSDQLERSALTSELREELLTLDVNDVRHSAAPPIDHTKGSALEWAQLTVTLAGALPPLIGALQAWAGRHPGSTITVKAHDTEITLPDATDEERKRLVEAWERAQGGC